MKTALRSIKPYYLYLILTGKKRIEVGKNYPKSKDWNRIVELYCSKDMSSFNCIPEIDRRWMREYLGKVACRFVCDMIDEFLVFENMTVQYWNYHNLEKSCLTYDEIANYIGANKNGYAWHISDLKIYDKPKELGEFYRWKKCDSCKMSGYEATACMYDIDCKVPARITRPPQSWMYVGEV